MARRKAAPQPPPEAGYAPPRTGAGPVVTAILAVVFILGCIVRVANVGVASRSPDEKIYAAQARAAAQSGIQGTRRVVDAFLKNPELWLYPPPTRIGYSYLVAGVMKLTGTDDERAGSYLSCVCSILTLLTTIFLGLRFFGPWITVFGTLFLAVFPPELAIAQRCWTDAPVGLAGVLMAYFTMQIWSGEKSLRPLVLLPVAGSVAALIKETTPLFYGPYVLAALWALWRRRRLRDAAILFGAAAAGAAATIALRAVCAGSIAVPFRIMIDQAKHNTTNPYALDYCSGPGYLLLLAFWKLSPLTIVLVAVGMLLAWLRPAVRDRSSVLLLAWLTMIAVAPYALVPHWLNLRYASASFAPLCLFAGAGLWQLYQMVRRKAGGEAMQWIAVGGAAVVLVFVAGDYQRFQRLVRVNAQDLSVKMVFDITADTP
jgi:4-amino-4-deoxy-L-arabinose transferase-like glycosyltransferase